MLQHHQLDTPRVNSSPPADARARTRPPRAPHSPNTHGERVRQCRGNSSTLPFGEVFLVDNQEGWKLMPGARFKRTPWPWLVHCDYLWWSARFARSLKTKIEKLSAIEHQSFFDCRFESVPSPDAGRLAWYYSSATASLQFGDETDSNRRIQEHHSHAVFLHFGRLHPRDDLRGASYLRLKGKKI